MSLSVERKLTGKILARLKPLLRKLQGVALKEARPLERIGTPAYLQRWYRLKTSHYIPGGKIRGTGCYLGQPLPYSQEPLGIPLLD